MISRRERVLKDIMDEIKHSSTKELEELAEYWVYEGNKFSY